MPSGSLSVPPRVVDGSLLVSVLILLGTGIGGLLAGRTGQWWVMALHGIAGVVLVPLLVLKLRRVAPRVRSASPTVLPSLLLALITGLALMTGLAWTLGTGLDVGPFRPLVVHGALGVGVALLLIVHLRDRFRLPTRDDLADRRLALRYAALIGVGAVAWRTQPVVNRLRDVTPRRFTGSRETGSDGGNSFPVTSWVADDPDPVDPGSWSLRVDGLVQTPRTFDYKELVGERDGTGSDRETTLRAVLDCTSGWYSIHDWQGIRGAEVLAAAKPTDAARWVTFHSVTGYRWSVPIEEAQSVLLATHVDGVRLSHGHGFPLRLVAPGRRGFQWVKWIDRVEVRHRRDVGELVAIFVSGFV